MSAASERPTQSLDERLAAAVAEAVALFPPLSEDAKDQIAVLLRKEVR